MDFISGPAVADAIDELIRGAEKGLVLVSPFFHPSQDQLRWLAEASLRDVNVRLFVRAEDLKPVELEIIERCESMAITVRHVHRLHAKLFASEKGVVLGSMNLTATSRDSFDVAVRIDAQTEPEAFKSAVRLLKDLEAHVKKPPLDLSGQKGVVMGLFFADQWDEIRRLALSGDVDAQELHRFCIACNATNRGDEVHCWRCNAKAVAESAPLFGGFCRRCGNTYSSTPARPLCMACYERDVRKVPADRPSGQRPAGSAPRGEGPPNVGQAWTGAMETDLRARWDSGETIAAIAAATGRTTGAIVARVVKMGLAPDRDAARVWPRVRLQGSENR